MNRLTFNYDDPEVQLHRTGVWENVKALRAEGLFTDDEDERAGRFLLLSAIFGTDADVIGRLARTASGSRAR